MNPEPLNLPTCPLSTRQHPYRTGRINLTIQGSRSLGQSIRLQVQRRRTRRRRWAPLKRMVMNPGLLKNNCLTYPTVGPSHSHPIHDFTESRQDSSTSHSTPTKHASPQLAAVGSPIPNREQALNNSVDTLENAIDFVLALEHPCMGHVPFPPSSGGDDPTNHMLLVRCF